MTAVVLLAKAPRAGAVKTRLAREVGAHRALEVYRALGERVVRQLGDAYAPTVWYEPPEALDEMRAWLGEREYRPQSAGDLGERLAAALAFHLAAGQRPVLAIGADVPGITAETVRRAEALLERADVVLGPAEDGGYYLVGVTREHPTLFRGMPWGSNRVLGATLAVCRREGLAVAQLERLRDVDTVADLAAVRRERP